jgi:hypothetical protein
VRDHVRFHSIEFTPPDIEPGQINTERYGYTLATWVGERLKERGFEVDTPIPEDWGWLLGVKNDGQIIRVGCGNVDGSVTEWLVWVDVLRGGMLSRLLGGRGTGGPNAVYGVAAAIHGALAASANAGEIEWFRVGPRGQELDHAPTPI